jgi:hypothetical protein
MLRLTNLAALALALATVTHDQSLGGQTERQDPHVRNDCRLATQVLAARHPHPHYDWALEFIAKCEETGGPVLAGLWRRPSADSAHLDRLFLSSYTLRDSRITAAVIDAASDRSLPQLVRLNAIRVLAGHAVPEFLLSIPDLLRQESDSVRSLFPSVDHVNVRNGDSPVGTSTVRTIVETLEVLKDDPDGRIALAASRTHRQLCSRLQTPDCSSS